MKKILLVFAVVLFIFVGCASKTATVDTTGSEELKDIVSSVAEASPGELEVDEYLGVIEVNRTPEPIIRFPGGGVCVVFLSPDYHDARSVMLRGRGDMYHDSGWRPYGQNLGVWHVRTDLKPTDITLVVDDRVVDFRVQNWSEVEEVGAEISSSFRPRITGSGPEPIAPSVSIGTRLPSETDFSSRATITEVDISANRPPEVGETILFSNFDELSLGVPPDNSESPRIISWQRLHRLGQGVVEVRAETGRLDNKYVWVNSVGVDGKRPWRTSVRFIVELQDEGWYTLVCHLRGGYGSSVELKAKNKARHHIELFTEGQQIWQPTDQKGVFLFASFEAKKTDLRVPVQFEIIARNTMIEIADIHLYRNK